MDEIDLWGGMGIGMSFGQDFMILTIQNHARENATLLGVYLVVFGLFLGPQGPPDV